MSTSNQPLFRVEPGVAGRARECAAFAHSPTTRSFLIYSICLLVIAGLVYASKQHLARKATIPGRVELAEGELKLYVDSRRMVESVLVSDGELVTQGQTLALLRRPDHSGARFGSGQSGDLGYGMLVASLQSEAQRLSSAALTARQETEAKRKAFKSKMLTLKETYAQLNEELKILAKLKELSAEQLERGREINGQGHLSLVQLEELQQRHTENDIQLSSGTRNALDLRDRLESLDHETQMLDLNLVRSLSQIEEARGRNARELTRLKMNLETTLKAPADGVITGVLAHAGSTVDSTRPLITMVKNAARFRARLWAKSSAAGELHNGQRVNLMLDAFPHQKHGMLVGHVTHINESPLSLRELDAPWEGAGPTYSVTVAMNPESELYPRIKPGMNLSADIKLDESLLVERLFEPLIQAWQRTL